MTVRCSISKKLLRVCACLLTLSPPAVQAAKQARPGIWEAIRNYASQQPPANKTVLPERVVQFPADRSLGRIVVQDIDKERQIKGFVYWDDGYWNKGADYLGQAQGDVVIPTGKNVQLTVNKNAVRDLSPLLKLKPDDICKLSLRFLPAGNDCMQYVAHLTGLNELDLYGTRISTTGLQHIAKLPLLETLTLPGHVTDGNLALVGQMTSLKALYLVESRATDQGLAYLGALTSLEKLSLAGRRMNGSGLVYLEKLPSLHYLMLNGDNFGGPGFASLRKIPSLKTLCCYDAAVSDAGLRNLSGHPVLENLAVLRGRLTNRGLAHLKTIASLKKVDIYKESKVTDDGMIHLAAIDTLEYLDLPGITDKGIETVANMKNLKTLNIGGGPSCNVTDAALKDLSKVKSLEGLVIPGSNLTDAGMEYLARLTNLKTLQLHFSSDLTDEGLAKLKTLRLLESLIFGSESVTISGLSHLNEFKNLSRLSVSGIRQDNSGMDISGLINLEDLTLKLSPRDKVKDYDPVRDEDLACLKNLKKLRKFQIAYSEHSEITDAGVFHLKDLTNMDFLNIGSRHLTDKSLSYLAGMKKLDFLRIVGNFTDDGLSELEHFDGLTHLHISTSGAFSPQAIRKLRQALRNVDPQYLRVEQNKNFK